MTAKVTGPIDALDERVKRLEKQMTEAFTLITRLSKAGEALTSATMELTDLTHDGFRKLGISG